jgi:hypothetical protein
MKDGSEGSRYEDRFKITHTVKELGKFKSKALDLNNSSTLTGSKTLRTTTGNSSSSQPPTQNQLNSSLTSNFKSGQNTERGPHSGGLTADCIRIDEN